MPLFMQRRLFVTLTYLLFSSLLIWQVVNTARDWTLQNLHEQGSDELLQVVSQLRSALEEYRYLPFLISQNRDVNDLLATPFFDLRSEVSLYLEQINLVAGSSSLFVLNSDGQALAYSHWRDEQDFFLRSHQDQSYYQQASEGHRGRQFSLNADSQSPAYFLSSPIYNGTRFTGAAVVRIEINNLMRKLRSTGTVLFRNADDTLFFSTNGFTRFTALQPQVSASNEILSNDITATLWRHNQQQWLERSVILDDLQWQVTVLHSTDIVKRNMRTGFLFSFGGCLALGLIALFWRERQLKLRSQNETRQTLARSEAQQKAIINNAQVGLLLVDEQGAITFANEMVLQQFAISTGLIMHKAVTELLASDAITPVHRVLNRLSHKGFSPLIGYEAIGRRADKSEFPILISIRKMQINPTQPQHHLQKQDRLYLVTVIDITRRKNLELELYQANLSLEDANHSLEQMNESLEEANHSLERANESLEDKVEIRTQALKAAQQELVQAEKMAALGRMSSAVVHELNQPLTALRNYVAICKQMLQQPDMLEDSLHTMDDLTQRMAKITAQLKTFAYKKPEQSQPVSLHLAIEQALLLFKQRIEVDQINLNIQQPSESVYISGDSARLEQVLVNLIKNALDALDATDHSHGDDTGEPESPAKNLSINIQVTSEITLIIEDNGCGIEPELLPQLFDPFVTSKTIGQGLGLGLAIVRSIVQDLGGSIRAENCLTGTTEPLDNSEKSLLFPKTSKANETNKTSGARFIITLPICPLDKVNPA